MQLFVITREGIYRHEIGGVFSSFDAAIAEAKRLLLDEPDARHTYMVLLATLDSPVCKTERQSYGGFGERPKYWRVQWVQPSLAKEDMIESNIAVLDSVPCADGLWLDPADAEWLIANSGGPAVGMRVIGLRLATDTDPRGYVDDPTVGVITSVREDRFTIFWRHADPCVAGSCEVAMTHWGTVIRSAP